MKSNQTLKYIEVTFFILENEETIKLWEKHIKHINFSLIIYTILLV